MRYGRGVTRVGPSFFEKIGKTAQRAATAANRNDKPGYLEAREEIIAFLDEVGEAFEEEQSVEETKPTSTSSVGKKGRAAKPKAKTAKGE